MSLRRTLLSLTLLGATLIAAPTQAAKEYVKPIELDWSFDGPLGAYDKDALQRGFLIYKQVCAACHSMSKLSYRNLEGIGYDEAQVKAIAMEYRVTDGPNDEGEMFERPGRPSDRFVSPYANPEQARAANNGAYPPDMSLIAHARKGGADYLYSLLVGYEEPPEGKELLPGQYWNKYMPGHIIAMAPPLMDGQIPYPDGSPETVDQYAKDVAHFLQWAADPKMEERKAVGIRVMIFLFFFTLVFYLAKRKIWKDVK